MKGKEEKEARTEDEERMDGNGYDDYDDEEEEEEEHDE